MTSYFGIDNGQAAASGFNADSGFRDVGVTISLNVRLTDRWAFIGEVGYSLLLSDAADSPIVDDLGSPDQWQLITNLGYRF